MEQSDPAASSSQSASATNTLAALIPAYNPGATLQLTLESIASQPVLCEIFVVDDGSDPAIELPDQINNKRIHLMRIESNTGIANALNTGLREILARGFEFLSRHDCGDIDHPERLTTQLKYLQDNPAVALLGTSVDFCSDDGDLYFRFIAPQTTAAVVRKMAFSAAVVHPSCMFRAQALRQVGLYSDAYPHAEDYELFFRLLERYEAHNLSRVLLRSAYAPEGISISNRRSSLNSRLRLQLRYFRVTKWQSYVGVLQTLALVLIPYRFVSQMKGRLFFRRPR